MVVVFRPVLSQRQCHIRSCKYYYHYQQTRHESTATANTANTAYIAFGSNLGNRSKNITTAIEKLKQFGTISKTSFIYESLPMYKTDQPNFLNGALEIRTKQSPLNLLSSLKQIEKELGRITYRNEPRPIDLDIILYKSNQHIVIMNDIENDLIIPHPRLTERQFVLRPLLDINPNIITVNGQLLKDIYHDLKEREGDVGLTQVTPLPGGRLLEWGRRTLLMGVLNITPDSFSDGGKYTNIDNAIRKVEQFIQHDFDIIDIGGQSTRPGAKLISTEEETQRVIPVIQKLVQEFPSITLSIDTFNPKVAKQSLDNGAQLVNDITACQNHSSEMSKMLKETKAPIIVMHMRGTPETMQSLTTYNNNENITEQVGKELLENTKKLMDSIDRWSVIADTGIGFAKTANHNVELMKNGQEFKNVMGGVPCLLGTSRKSWMKFAGVSDRDWGTAGAVAVALCKGGVDIVRVHEPRIADTVKACDFIVRRTDSYMTRQ